MVEATGGCVRFCSQDPGGPFLLHLLSKILLLHNRGDPGLYQVLNMTLCTKTQFPGLMQLKEVEVYAKSYLLLFFSALRGAQSRTTIHCVWHAVKKDSAIAIPKGNFTL